MTSRCIDRNGPSNISTSKGNTSSQSNLLRDIRHSAGDESCVPTPAGCGCSGELAFDPTSPPVAARYATLGTSGLVAQVMQIAYGRSRNKAVDAKKVPASALKPSAEPLQCNKPSEKGKNCTEQARKCG